MKEAAEVRQGPGVSLRPTAILMLIAVSLFAVSGCGSSGKSTSSATTANVPAAATPSSVSATTSNPAAPPIHNDPETARFVSKAEAICKRLNIQLKNADARLPTKQGKLTVSAIIKGAPGNALMEAENLTDLSRLRPPAALAGTWREVLQLRRALERDIARLGPIARSNQKNAVKQLQIMKEEAHFQLSKVAARASLTECGVVG